MKAISLRSNDRKEIELILNRIIQEIPSVGQSNEVINQINVPVRGEKGEKGEKGDRGEKGDTVYGGATGPQGPAGLTGATGPQGPAGETGPQGPEGPQGDSFQESFESVAMNLSSVGATYDLNDDGAIEKVYYTNGVVKTYNFVGGKISSVVLSGIVPSGVDLTKTYVYINGKISGVTYA